MSCKCGPRCHAHSCECQSRLLSLNQGGVALVAQNLSSRLNSLVANGSSDSVAAIYGSSLGHSSLHSLFPHSHGLSEQHSNLLSFDNAQVRVSDANWIEQILTNLRANRDFEIVFDDPHVVNAAIDEIRRRIPPPFNFFAQQLDQDTRQIGPHSGVLADPIITPTVVIAIIAAIVVIGLALIIGIIMLFNTAMARDISQEAMRRGYNLCDVRPGGQGQGSGNNFNFVNDSRWVIRKNC